MTDCHEERLETLVYNVYVKKKTCRKTQNTVIYLLDVITL